MSQQLLLDADDVRVALVASERDGNGQRHRGVLGPRFGEHADGVRHQRTRQRHGSNSIDPRHILLRRLGWGGFGRERSAQFLDEVLDVDHRLDRRLRLGVVGIDQEALPDRDAFGFFFGLKSSPGLRAVEAKGIQPKLLVNTERTQRPVPRRLCIVHPDVFGLRVNSIDARVCQGSKECGRVGRPDLEGVDVRSRWKGRTMRRGW